MERDRTKSEGLTSGTSQEWYKYPSGWGVTNRSIENYSTVNRCIDQVLVGNNGMLSISKRSSSFAPLNGMAQRSSKWYQTFSNYRPDNLGAFSPYCGHIPVPGVPDNNTAALRLLKITNPSRPIVDLPVFIAELKDLPDLVRREGGKLIKRIAKNNLKYQFGLRPLISDIQSMLDFEKHFDNRMAELSQLSQSGLRRKRRIFSGSATETDDSVAMFNICSFPVSYKLQYVAKTEVWGFVKYKPTGAFPRSPEGQRALAKRAVLGLTLDASTAWELMPWSWLIDYFSTIGDYLAASRNIVPCTVSTPLLMEHKRTECKATRVRPGSWTGAVSPDGSFTYETKTRRLHSVSNPINADLPVLSLRQMSILASLYVTRSRRYD